MITFSYWKLEWCSDETVNSGVKFLYLHKEVKKFPAILRVCSVDPLGTLNDDM